MLSIKKHKKTASLTTQQSILWKEALLEILQKKFQQGEWFQCCDILREMQVKIKTLKLNDNRNQRNAFYNFLRKNRHKDPKSNEIATECRKILSENSKRK